MNAVNQWLSANRMTSYKLRNEKAAEVIALSSYMMQKMSAGSKGQD